MSFIFRPLSHQRPQLLNSTSHLHLVRIYCPSRVYLNDRRRRISTLNPLFFSYSEPTTSTTMSAKEQPAWQQPEGRISQLKLYNSLTRTKNLFVTMDPRGKKITWYCCGPTVYDAPHLGHARNYVTTDCLRRILEGYFGYNVQFVQNVTDIDDKIILKARQSHLFNNFVAKNPSATDEVRKVVQEAWKAYLLKAFKTEEATPDTFISWASKTYPKLVSADGTILAPTELDESLSGEELEKEAKSKMHLRTLLAAANQIVSPDKQVDGFYAGVKDVLAPYLDSKDGHSVTDPKVFRETAAFWEKAFNDDMAMLNVLPPTATTRVSEFVPENVDFVKKLVDKGFAYAVTDGSVYFDVEAYRATGHFYAKLKPWNVGNQALLADGEGALTAKTGEKKNAGDFALWKGSKPGEPGWESPWGRGRPGWHIECSVMCSEVLGNKVDIHSGGIDLAFPHHDNEIAQSEAYWDPCTVSEPKKGDKKHQWVNYFIHMGHLEISGAKMSKSLKNFTSIREALGRDGGWTSRRLRIVFLQGVWKDRIEIRDNVVTEAKGWESTVDKFFTNVKGLVSEQAELESKGEMPEQLFGKPEAALNKDFDNARNTLDEALCDSFNTSGAMNAILDIISKANVYITNSSKEGSYLSIALVSDIARWVTKMVNIFGLDSAPISPTSIGWSRDDGTATAGGSGDKEEIALPYLRVLSGFRDKVRAVAVSGAIEKKTLLDLCDRVRDDDLPALGVVLDDRDSGLGKPALIKFDSPERLLAEKKEKEAKLQEKEAKKEQARLEREKAEKERMEKGRLPPELMFKEGPDAVEYSEWDETGMPTKDKEGKEVAKSKLKKLKGMQDKQKKMHEQYLAWKEKEGAGSSTQVVGKD